MGILLFLWRYYWHWILWDCAWKVNMSGIINMNEQEFFLKKLFSNDKNFEKAWKKLYFFKKLCQFFLKKSIFFIKKMSSFFKTVYFLKKVYFF